MKQQKNFLAMADMEQRFNERMVDSSSIETFCNWIFLIQRNGSQQILFINHMSAPKGYLRCLLRDEKEMHTCFLPCLCGILFLSIYVSNQYHAVSKEFKQMKRG